MSKDKAVTAGAKYKLAGNTSTPNGKAITLKVVSQVSTHSLLWILVKRHKVALLTIGNVVLVLNWMIPAWPTIVRSLFN